MTHEVGCVGVGGSCACIIMLYSFVCVCIE